MRPRIVRLALVGASLCLALLGLFLLPKNVPTVWRGWRILLVEASEDEARVLESLHAAGFREVLSESLQPFQMTDYSSLVTISLEAARRRLTEGDPRRDSYLERLSGWFHASVAGKDYRVFYIRDPGSSGLGAGVSRALARSQAAWLLPEQGDTGGNGHLPGLLVILASLVLCLAAWRKREGLFCAAAVLPWCVIAMGSREAAALAAVWAPAMAFSAIRALGALDEYRLSGDWRTSLGVLLGEEATSLPFLLPAMGLVLVKPSFVPSMAMGLVASGLALVYAAAVESGARRQRRIPFRAVGIGWARPEGRVRVPTGKLLPPFLACAAVSILGLAAGLAGSASTGNNAGSHLEGPAAAVLLPQPRGSGGSPSASRPGPKDALSARSQPGGEELVNMADWLVHRWYEEAIFYLPLKERSIAPFSPVSVPLPSRRNEVTMIFDESWAREAYRSRSQGGIESLLLSGPGFTRCFMATLEAGKARPLAPMEVILYIILLAPPSVGAFSLVMGGFRKHREQRKAQ